MKELWFKRKTYGWGWTPATWQGWLATLIYALLSAAYPIYAQVTKSEFSVLLFLLGLAILTWLFLWLCSAKGEKPQWQWGRKSNSKH